MNHEAIRRKIDEVSVALHELRTMVGEAEPGEAAPPSTVLRDHDHRPPAERIEEAIVWGLSRGVFTSAGWIAKQTGMLRTTVRGNLYSHPDRFVPVPTTPRRVYWMLTKDRALQSAASRGTGGDEGTGTTVVGGPG